MKYLVIVDVGYTYDTVRYFGQVLSNLKQTKQNAQPSS